MRPARPFCESDVREVERLLRTGGGSKAQLQRMQCVLLRARQGLSSRQVSELVGWHPGWVRQVWSAFVRQGAAAVVCQARGGRRRANLTPDQERALVERFETRAGAGGVLVVSQIHEAYQAQAGHAVARSTIYRMLARHGWRKVAPRPQHPKNDPEACRTFKKNFPS